MFELAGINCMNMYIPGETLENKKMRKFIISQGNSNVISNFIKKVG